MHYKIDYKNFLTMAHPHYDFAIIDPPWKYNQAAKKPVAKNQLNYSLFESNTELLDILKLIDVDYIFLWVTNPMLGEVFNILNQQTIYKYKNIVTWVKTKNNKICWGMGYYFRNATEQLLVLSKSKTKALRLPLKNVIIEDIGKRTIKPHDKEKEIVDALSLKGMKGIYIFSGGALDFIDTVDLV